MIALNRILCAVDDSAVSRHAFAQAIALARQHRASVTALHVSTRLSNGDTTHRPGGIAPAAPTPAEIQAQVRSFIAGWDTAVTVAVEIEEGPAATVIAAAAERLPADLIVMGTHGRLNVRYAALGTLGSVTSEVVRRAPCPVLVVPPGAPAPPDVRYRRILCAVDFGPASQRAAAYAASLAHGPDATLILVYVVDPPPAARTREPYDTRPPVVEADAARRALAALLPAAERERCSIAEMVRTGTPHREILRLAGSLRPDLIVMGTGARSAAEIMLLGSTTDPVLRRAACPVLTIGAASPDDASPRSAAAARAPRR